ncbi:MAG: DoxX family protein [Hyphomicrobiales bacterium]|nr:DoxX family protein [Hyphomicrobiales bacterium]
MSLIERIVAVHTAIFSRLQTALDGWFLEAAARFVFAGVLLLYYLNSAKTKVGSGFPDMFVPQVGAYAQILPKTTESVGYDISQIAFLPYGLMVLAGTYAEFILPVLIVLGLFTRLAGLGMIGFIAVQSYVDINFHGADEKTIGALFDRFSDSLISDQRTLWVFVLLVLVVRGGGALSLDYLLGRRFAPDRA